MKITHHRKQAAFFLFLNLFPASYIDCCASCCGFQGVMEENAILSGDNAFNAHFGECIAAIGDIDDDGFQGQPNHFLTPMFTSSISR